MGEMPVPAGAYYGASTARAVINFPVSDLRFPRDFIRALGLIKQCAARVNLELGDLDQRRADAIIRAAEEVVRGDHDRDFVVDIFQTGSGTSTNMNANEVIANRAIEILGGERGDRDAVHPNDHVNLSMSSNDVVPTAIHLAASMTIEEKLRPALSALAESLRKKSIELMPVLKTGRTHLQDATPVTLGQEFAGYTGQIERALERLDFARERLSQVALGGTAVGTGINARPDFARRVLALIGEQIGLSFFETDNHFQAQSTIDEVVETSGVLKTIAVSLTKIGNDLRWLSSGPRAGLGEIELPEVQPGSSIMPGKINPVIAESLVMVCAQVLGNDATIAIAGQSGNFELNVMLPVAAYNLLQSIEILAGAVDNFKIRCIDGLKATGRGPEMVERGLALVTALVPEIGYDRAAAIAHQAVISGRTIKAVALESSGLTSDHLDELLDPRRMTGLDAEL